MSAASPDDVPAMKGILGLATCLLVSCTGSIFSPGEDPGSGGPTPIGGVGPISVGVTPLHRLSQEQVQNLVFDLTGVTSAQAAALPPDEAAGGFANNVIAPVSELLVAQFQQLAEEVATKATATRLDALAPCDDAVNDRVSCTQTFIRHFGRLAFRRPLDVDEETRYAALAATAADYANGIRLTVEGMLESPYFWYRFELDDPAAVAGSIAAVGPFERATRLSFFLWSSGPDDTLLDAAQSGALATLDGVRAQAQRMMTDPRFVQTIRSFHLQWLELGPIDTLEKDLTVYPTFTPDLRAAMKEEIGRFLVDAVVSGDGRFDDILSGTTTEVNAPLYDLYGLTGGRPASTSTWVTTPTAPQRLGVLTLAGVLATHAHANQSALVRRGKLIRERFLCTMMAAPPPNVNTTVPAPDPNTSSAERFAQHRTDPACSGCHDLMDPLGTPFEGFDGIGAARTMDGNVAVDTTGTLVGAGPASDGNVVDATDLIDRLSTSDIVRQCYARQWLRFAIGRGDTVDDAPSVQTLEQAFLADQDHVRSLLESVVVSDVFLHRKVTP
jgi:hypothetical protein